MMQPPPYGSSYDQVLARLRKQVHDQDIEGRVLALLQSGFENALEVESGVLSRPERERLFQTVMGDVLDTVTRRVKGDHA